MLPSSIAIETRVETSQRVLSLYYRLLNPQDPHWGGVHVCNASEQTLSLIFPASLILCDRQAPQMYMVLSAGMSLLPQHLRAPFYMGDMLEKVK